jgi:hypothetical protein
MLSAQTNSLGRRYAAAPITDWFNPSTACICAAQNMYLDSLHKAPGRYQDNGAGWPTHRRNPVTIANPTIAPVPVPAGVEHVSEWNDAAPNARLDGNNSRSRAGHRCRSNETMCARRRKEDITWLV